MGGDYCGSVYRGTAKEDAKGWITLDLSMEIPTGTTLVEGSSPQDVPQGRGLHAYLPPIFGDGSPQEMQGGGGAWNRVSFDYNFFRREVWKDGSGNGVARCRKNFPLSLLPVLAQH